MSRDTLCNYPQTNEELIKGLNLQPHPEGGHYALTHVTKQTTISPFASEDGDRNRSIQSTIYYLLSIGQDVRDTNEIHNHRSAIGYMHKNKSETMHLLHTGRVKYTLISTHSKPPQIRQVVMGEDLAKGEVRQLMVGGDEWKVSEIPKEDRDWAISFPEKKNYVGGLISEVVTPGFDWKDHEYITMTKLKNLFGSDQESIDRFSVYVLPEKE